MRCAGGSRRCFIPEEMAAVCRAVEWAGREEPPEPDEEEEVSPWVDAGLRQLERSAFLDLNQDAQVYTFHQTLLDHVRREEGLTPEQRAAGTVGLLRFHAAYLRANTGNYPAIDRCFDHALALMESAWQGREGAGPLDAALAGMADSLGYYFEQRGLWQTGVRWHERAIDLRRTSPAARDEAALAHELYRWGVLLAGRGEPGVAREALAESIELCEKVGNRQGQAASLHELAIIEEAQGNPTEARRLLQRSLQIDEALGDQRGQAASLHELARIEFAQGNPTGNRSDR
jgi:tetratricopeptide (TPR) repeat protein